MYDALIPAVIETFASPGESEQAFLGRVRESDIRLTESFRTKGVVKVDYHEPLIRAAYLLRYLGHYTHQLGDLLLDLERTPAASVLARADLRLAALCGGPCPEAIALAFLHQDLGGQRLQAYVLDKEASCWQDCWPIIQRIAGSYPAHGSVTIAGMAVDVLQSKVSALESSRLARADVFTALNCLNELVGIDQPSLSRGLAARLALLPAGSLVLASDQAGYPACERGLTLLHGLLHERGASILISNLDPGAPYVAENRYQTPERIAWIYSGEDENRFRIWNRQLRLAALLP